ncbi:PEP/pyruvate-binding domain-containing protein [Desulfopila inferna]|uniref:PEP/pyruvate-binding domain-containing protein n=1 Tax=Desulfopila inferna TaxID=468528 RepID=UPI001F0595DE|nr:PEP/pyruvate-binding domain-containing protein [Desulfopila inferna]
MDEKRMEKHLVTIGIDSDALRANLLETAGEVVIASELEPLLDIVKKFKGIHSSLESLLYEISHPFRNWEIIIPLLRSFALRNFSHFIRHEKGPHAVRLFGQIFFEAIKDSEKNSALLAQIIEAKLAWIEKILHLLDAETLLHYESALNEIFEKMQSLEDGDSPIMLHIVQGQHPMKRLATLLHKASAQERIPFDYRPVASLMRTVLLKNYGYWLGEDDPMPWFFARSGILKNEFHSADLFNSISHQSIHRYRRELQDIDIEKDPYDGLGRILELPAHVDIVRFYKQIPARLAESAEEEGRLEAIDIGNNTLAENWKLLFLFKIMNTEGLYLIHEESLREINRSLVQLIRQQSFEEIEEFLLTTFELLRANVNKYPHTSLQCIQVLGGEVFNRGNSRMVEAFLFSVVRFGFQYANVIGVDEDWQPLTNPAHLSNIRVWLHLIEQEPKWCSTLFSALIINLKLTGTCVKDTDLFQRDITELLNHPIEPIYNLAKQFTKLMPVFFNEIGAEGELRDVSTELDELHKRQDVLIHFLRKQSHVESSNLIVNFIKAIFYFWKNKDKERLKPFLPAEVYSQVSTSGRFIDEQHILTTRLFADAGFEGISNILDWDSLECKRYLDAQDDLSVAERRRFELLVHMYKLLDKKYNLGIQELRSELIQASQEGIEGMDGLLDDLKNSDTISGLKAMLSRLEALKEIILSEECFEAQEDIYYKRHIAVDIPSVYGRYRERKFDSLSLTFRLENLANTYLENLPETVNLSFITQATLYRVVTCIELYLRALKIDGITSRRLDIYLTLLRNSLKVRRFSYTQYLDIFRGMAEGVKDIIYAFYTNIHQNNLSIIIPQISAKDLLTKYRSKFDENDKANTLHRLSEAFFRDLIASTFGLQHLDNFIIRILQTLENQRNILDKEGIDLLMTYNPEKAISSLYKVNPYTNNLIHLGNKGFNLLNLINDNKPVPAAFVITTEVFRCRDVVFDFSKAREEFMQRIRAALTEIEERTGKIFGSPDKPLLLSIRSGGAISMPGMMATIHNAGYNEELIEEHVREHGNAYLCWDNFRRFVQSWAMISGMKREDFQELMDNAKKRYNVKLKREFSSEQMKELALSYRELARKRDYDIPEDPWLQLIGGIERVLDSWETRKARDYRKVMDVSNSWGTAVIVQEMVFGNRSDSAGSGVLFTSHPYRKVQRVALWGDYAYGDQGEDIVSGLVTSRAISVEQAELDGREIDDTLEVRFPEIYHKLLLIARDLVYEKRWNPQEIEFTFEGASPDDLYLLQTRDMITIKKKERLNVFVETPDFEQYLLGKGVGVSGSALSGRAVFSEGNIRELRRTDPESQLILFRQDTVPEDVKVINMADGLITSRGGQTSHASVVAVRLEKTCVVGCKHLKVYENWQYCEIDGVRIGFGDPVAIDGRNGLLLRGNHEIREEMHILPI